MEEKLKYRDITDQKIKEFNKIHDYAFDLHEGKKEYNNEEDYREILGTLKGLFNEDELLCCFELFNLDCKLRGTWLNLGGVGSVISPPENRGKGYIRNMFIEALCEMRENNILLSALWPFSYPFYRRLGYEQASSFKSYFLKPKKLKFAKKYNYGQFRRSSIDDYQILNKIYEKNHQKYDLQIKRSRKWWEKKVVRKNFIYILEKNQNPSGYLIYSAEKENGKNNMYVSEFAAVDHDSYLEILRFLYYHDSQVENIKLFAANDNLLIKHLPDPRIQKNSIEPGAMFRIVDVKKLLSVLKYPENYTGSIILKVKDSILDFNDGSFILGIKSGKGSCRRIDDNEQIEFEIDINLLAPIVTGFITPTQAYKLNLMKSSNENIVDKLEKIFPTRNTQFLNFF